MKRKKNKYNIVDIKRNTAVQSKGWLVCISTGLCEDEKLNDNLYKKFFLSMSGITEQVTLVVAAETNFGARLINKLLVEHKNVRYEIIEDINIINSVMSNIELDYSTKTLIEHVNQNPRDIWNGEKGKYLFYVAIFGE